MSNTIHGKVCTKCLESKPSEEFSKDSSKVDGLYSSCKFCSSLSRRKVKKTREQLDMHNASTTRYRNKLRTENPEHLLYQTARTSALNRNLDFDLSVEDITIPKTCPILGIPIDVFAKKQFNSPSVDRVDNSKGYVKGNVKIISSFNNNFIFLYVFIRLCLLGILSPGVNPKIF